MEEQRIYHTHETLTFEEAMNRLNVVDVNERSGVLFALASSHPDDPRVAAVCLRETDSTEPENRRSAALCLGTIARLSERCGHPEFVPKLEAMLEDSAAAVRGEAAVSLGDLGCFGTAKPYSHGEAQARMNSGDTALQTIALFHISRYDDDQEFLITWIKRLAAHPSPALRGAVMEAISKPLENCTQGVHDELVAILESATQDKHWYVRDMANSAIEFLKFKERDGD